MKYCFDTSVFIHAALRAYPQINFPSFWNNLDTLIQSGNVVCPKAVLNELEKKDDDLLSWAKMRAGKLIIEHDQPIQNTVTQIMADPVYRNWWTSTGIALQRIHLLLLPPKRAASS